MPTNLFAYNVDPANVKPTGAEPTIILVASGHANHITNNNHVVSNIGTTKNVVLDGSTVATKVLDSGSSEQFVSYSTNYTFRPTH